MVRKYLFLSAALLGAVLGITLLTSADAKPAARPAAKKTAIVRPAASNGASNAALTASYNAYLNRVRSKLDHNWYVADGKNHVVLTATIASDGSVTGVNLSSTPSDTKAEQAATDAFNQTQPLGALPGGSQSIKLTLTFDSTADPHGDTSRSIGAKVDSVAPAAATPKPEPAPSN